MYKIIVVNNHEVKLRASALTKHFYHKVFHRDLWKDMTGCDIRPILEFQKLTKERTEGITDPEEIKRIKSEITMEIGPEKLIEAKEFLGTISRLGFIMMEQTKDFDEFWNRTTYEDYLRWLDRNEEELYQNKEFIDGVMQVWLKNEDSKSDLKNQ